MFKTRKSYLPVGWLYSEGENGNGKRIGEKSEEKTAVERNHAAYSSTVFQLKTAISNIINISLYFQMKLS